MANWNEADHPRDDEGKFTYKNGGSSANATNDSEYKNANNDDYYSPEENEYNFDNAGLGTTPVLTVGVSMKYDLKNEKPEVDFYTQDLIDEIKNTKIEIDGIGKIPVGVFIPDIENYIEDNRSIDDKHSDILYPTMRKEHPIKTDLKLLGKMFPYFVERMNIELEKNGKEKVTGVEVMDSFEWNIAAKNFLEAIKQRKKFTENQDEFKTARSIEKFLSYMEGSKENPTDEERKRQEALKEMLDDFINGGDLSMYFASTDGGFTHLGANIPNAAGLLRINGKYSNLNINYTKDAEKFNSINELPPKYKDIIKEKVHNQKHLKSDMKGLYFSSDSDLSKRIALSPEILGLVKDKKYKIRLFCDYESDEHVFNLKGTIELKSNYNLLYAFHNADIHNLKYDIFGNISGDLVDTTDFNPDKKEPILIQKAYELQQEGKIDPKFVIVHFVIPREFVYNEILNEE